MSQYIIDAYEWVVAALEDGTDATVITDPRNARPPCILVEPPSITANQNKTLAQLEFPITILGIPPGNKDTVQFLLTVADDVIEAVGPTTGGPSVYTIGNQDCPAYTLTATIQIRRN